MTKIPYTTRRRLRKLFNFISFNLLFFALYLNFIKKDTPVEPNTMLTPPKEAVSIQEKSVNSQKGI
jgi:hypothetical protein